MGVFGEGVADFAHTAEITRIEQLDSSGNFLRDVTLTDRTTGKAWQVQRRCPHLKADLTRFGIADDGTLTCQLHGWKFDLDSGRCLTSVGHPLRSHPAEAPAPADT